MDELDREDMWKKKKEHYKQIDGNYNPMSPHQPISKPSKGDTYTSTNTGNSAIPNQLAGLLERIKLLEARVEALEEAVLWDN